MRIKKLADGSYIDMKGESVVMVNGQWMHAEIARGLCNRMVTRKATCGLPSGHKGPCRINQ